MTARQRIPLLYDAVLEEAVLGGMMVFPDVLRVGLERLTTEDFGDTRHRHLFRVMGELGSDIGPTRVAHRAQVEWPGDPGEVRPYVATLQAQASSTSIGIREIGDLLDLRDRRRAADASELIAKAVASEDPEAVLRLARGLIAEESSSNGHRPMSAAWLLETDFPEPNWVVPSWLPEGLCLFAGRPKARKSFLMLQLCMAKATGGRFLGHRLEAGPVIYFALEDGPKRLAERLRALECPRGIERLQFEVVLPRMDRGGLEYVQRRVQETGAQLVVVDTLEKAMVGCDRPRDRDVNAHYTTVMSPWHDWSLEAGVALVFVDHLRKPGMTKRSLLSDVMGATAKVGVADTIWGLWRDEGETKGELQMNGRDVEESAHLLEWRPTPLAWQYTGDLEAARLSESERIYVEAVRELGPGVDSKSVADYAGVTTQAAQEMLRKLREKGTLRVEVQKKAAGGRTFLYSVS